MYRKKDIGINKDRLFAVSDNFFHLFFPNSRYSQIKTLRIAIAVGMRASSNKKISSAVNEILTESHSVIPFKYLI